MIKLIKIATLLLVIVLTTACSTDEITLQKYYVESENKSNILMLDLPPSLLEVSTNMSAESKAAIKTIDKLNILAFKLNSNNKADFISEKAKVKQILANGNFQNLINLNSNGVKFKVNYLGTDELMDEVIVYVEDNEKGFALGRLTGNNMKPEQMIALLENVKEMNLEDDKVKKLFNFFK